MQTYTSCGRGLWVEMTAAEAVMHLDGCHFYVWVYNNGEVDVLDWSERTGSDLYLHSDSKCARCSALRNGAAPIGAITVDVPDLPRDGRAAFLRILEVIADDERMIA